MQEIDDDLLLLPDLDLGENDYFDVLPQIHVPEYYRREKGMRKRKRRCKNPTYMPEIRILRRDIRRYAEMLLNVANAHDPSLLQRLVEEIFHPDCEIIRSGPFRSRPSKLIVSFVYNKLDPVELVSGAKELLKEYSYHCKMVPDSVFLLQESIVRVKQGYGGSVVTAKWLSKGTQMFQIDVNEGQSQYNCVPIATPIETMVELRFVLVLDEMNYIKQFHIDACMLLERPVSVNENRIPTISLST